MRGVSAVDSRGTLARLYRYMAAYRLRLALLFLLMLLSIACSLAIPLVVERAMNALSLRGGFAVDADMLGSSVAAFVALAVVSAALGTLQERLSAELSLRMALSMRKDAFSSLMGSTVSTFEGMRRGDLMSRLTNDAELAAGAFAQSLMALVMAALSIVGCVVIMFGKCPPLATVAVVSAVVSVVLMGMLSRIVLPRYIEQQAALGQLNAHVEESLNAFRSCQALGRTEENRRVMSELSTRFYERRLSALRVEFLMGPLMLVFTNMNFIATVVFGVSQVMAGAITIGALQAFIMYSKQFMNPLSAFSDHLVRMQNAIASAERVFYLIDLAPEVSQLAALGVADAGVVRTAMPLVSFEHVRFSYHANVPVIRDVSLEVMKGERLAIVGRTGEGKTTLARLLLLFYPDFAGAIALEGSDVRSLDVRELRRRIAYVAQEPEIVDGTLLDNVRYGCEGADEEEVRRTIAELGIDRLAARLPAGLETELSSITGSMSQGELQLVCLARAMLRKSDIIVLDEATSSLDPLTESFVRRGLETAMRDRTAIIIAHRLQSVCDADHIVVLAGGVVAEYGTHRELMQRDGVYRDLYHSQYLGKEL